MYLGACNIELTVYFSCNILSFCHMDRKSLNGILEVDLIGIILAKG